MIQRLYIGTHKAHHLAKKQAQGHSTALFVSARTLRPRRSLPRARGPWALDSGAFTEISKHGRWTTTPEQYVAEVRRYRREIGRMEWAAIQDWMCEPHILKRTGLTVQEHQARTIQSYLELRRLAPEVPWLPVLQGWTLEDYQAHVEAYLEAGVDLRELPLVGIGSICRRQGTAEALAILEALHSYGLRLHAFGMKSTGLLLEGWRWVTSVDSMAWSFHERKHRTGRQNSLEAAVDWAYFLKADLHRLTHRSWPWPNLFADPPDFRELAVAFEDPHVPEVDLELEMVRQQAIAEGRAHMPLCWDKEATKEATRRVNAEYHRGLQRGHYKPWGKMREGRPSKATLDALDDWSQRCRRRGR